MKHFRARCAFYAIQDNYYFASELRDIYAFVYAIYALRFVSSEVHGLLDWTTVAVPRQEWMPQPLDRCTSNDHTHPQEPFCV